MLVVLLLANLEGGRTAIVLLALCSFLRRRNSFRRRNKSSLVSTSSSSAPLVEFSSSFVHQLLSLRWLRPRLLPH